VRLGGNQVFCEVRQVELRQLRVRVFVVFAKFSQATNLDLTATLAAPARPHRATLFTSI
jgi:exosome complex RNA-binding protein Csl4